MKKIFIGLFLLAIALNIFGYVPDRVFWLSARTDDIPGMGTVCDPFDASSQVKLDALFDSFGTTPATVNFFPGDYYTSGNDTPRPVSIHVYSGWRVIGAGIDRTKIHYVGDVSKTVISSFYPIDLETSLVLDEQSYIYVADLTIDCGGFVDDMRQISGISLRGQNNNVIERVKVINSSSPTNENFILWVLGCGDHDNYNNAIRDCVVENCYGPMATCFTVSQALETGYYDIGGIIERNRALSGNIGASTWSSNGLTIRNNYFNGVNYGVNVDSGNNYNAVISENIINANSWDIVLGSSPPAGVLDRFVIQNNDFVTASTGLLFNGQVTNAVIRENKFSGIGDMAMAVNNTGNIDFTLINNDLGGMGIGILPRKANSQQPHITNANSLVTVINRCNAILLALETLGFLDVE